jgi:UV excision repair protein RAD23
MQLAVKTLKGEKFTVNAEETNTIAEVKTIIEGEKPELAAACMKLIHSGKVLKDTETIADCQLKPNAFLVVMISKPKKKPAAAAAVAEPPAAVAPVPVPEAPKTPAAASAASAAGDTSSDAVAATPANAAPSTSTPSAPSQNSNSNDNSNDNIPAAAVESLQAMGFPEAEVRACLRASGGNADVAVEFLMNGIPDYASEAMNSMSNTASSPNVSAGAASGGASASANAGAPLEQLRNHPQINQLRQLVQSNPSTLQAVLTQIGQQQPDLLQEINSHQELFLQIMNEPVSDAPGPSAPGASSSTSPGANAIANAESSSSPALGLGAGGLSPEMMQGLGNPAQLAQMIDSMTPEQLQSMSAMMGLTPEQLRMTAQAISRMPPEELQNYMSMAMQGEGMDMDGMAGMMGGGAGGGNGGAPPGAQVLRLSEEEMAAVDRLAGMGFDRSEAAQAYLACDKNEELAANLLMDGGFGFGDDPMDGPGGGNGDDMYD